MSRACTADPEKSALAKLNWQESRRLPRRQNVQAPDFDILFDKAIAPRRFSVIEFLWHLQMDRRLAASVFGARALRAKDFPESTYETFFDAATDESIVGDAPWAETLYTVEQAAEIFHLSTNRAKSSFRAALRDGEVPCYRFTARVVRLRKEDIVAFCKSKTRLHV